MGVGPSAQTQMQNTLFPLKFTAKNLVRESQKCTKYHTRLHTGDRTIQLGRCKNICSGLLDSVFFLRFYVMMAYFPLIYLLANTTQNAIREKNQSLNFLQLSSRIDGVCYHLFCWVLKLFIDKHAWRNLGSPNDYVYRNNREYTGCPHVLVCAVLQVAARVQTAVNMTALTKSMKGVVKGMDRVLNTPKLCVSTMHTSCMLDGAAWPTVDRHSFMWTCRFQKS